MLLIFCCEIKSWLGSRGAPKQCAALGPKQLGPAVIHRNVSLM